MAEMPQNRFAGLSMGETEKTPSDDEVFSVGIGRN
jgi:hypothetical protein